MLLTLKTDSTCAHTGGDFFLYDILILATLVYISFCYMKLACAARPVCSLETKLFQKNFYIAEEGNDMNRYEFILVDGSKIAVYANSRTEAAKKVREMLNS